MSRDDQLPQRHRREASLAALLIVVALGFSAVGVDGVNAQNTNRLDRDLFFSVYHADSPAFAFTMNAADRASWPLFVGTPFALWSVALNDNSRSNAWDAYMVTMSEAVTIGSIIALKRAFRRDRPYVSLQDVRDRSGSAGSRSSASRFSFPSGHAAISFSLATSLSLAAPQWYVVAPAYLVAATVSLSRVWLGVHFPSDILGGAVTGIAIAIVLDHFKEELTPSWLKPDVISGGRNVIPPVAFRVRF